MPAFRVVTTVRSGRVELAVAGEVDLSSAGELVSAGLAGLAAQPALILVVDLAEVTFMDSTGIGALVQLRNAAQESNTRMQLADVPERIHRLLHLTGLDLTFEQSGTD